MFRAGIDGITQDLQQWYTEQDNRTYAYADDTGKAAISAKPDLATKNGQKNKIQDKRRKDPGSNDRKKNEEG